MITQAGMYRMTLDMMEYTYTLEELGFAPYIYEIGNNTVFIKCTCQSITTYFFPIACPVIFFLVRLVFEFSVQIGETSVFAIKVYSGLRAST